MHNPYLEVFGRQIATSQEDHALPTLHALHPDTRNLSTDSYGKRRRLFKKARARRKARKACKATGNGHRGTYQWKSDPEGYCELLDASIDTHDEHLDIVRKLKHGQDLPSRLAKLPLRAIIGPFSQMVEMPLRMRKRMFNLRCKPCGYTRKRVWKTKKEKKAAGARKWSSFK